MGLAALLQLFNAAAPTIGSLILLIRHKDGTLSATAILDETDAQFAANQKQITDWLAQHPGAPVAGTPAG